MWFPERRRREQINMHSFWLRICLAILLCGVSLELGCTKKPEVAVKLPPRPDPVQPKPQPEKELSKLDQWHALVQEKRYAPLREKIIAVNEFFNEFEFVEDLYLWGKEDYWATLFETLTKSKGDCEDFTIAKYFTLRNLNIPDERMRITYVISLKSKKPHMVLTCNLNSQSNPYVLDTLNRVVLPISRRSDLVPVYSFNKNGYWLAKKEKGWQGEWLGSASKLSLWRDVLERMEIEGTKFARK